MKFFTSEWWRGGDGGDGQAAIRAYDAHAKAIRARLTPELIALEERISLHDARLLALSVEAARRTAVLRLKLFDGSDLELRYAGVISFESFQTPAEALIGPRGYGDLGYGELDVLADGEYEHRLLFSSSIELRFRFATLELWPAIDP